MFVSMEIVEYIYEDSVEPSYNNLLEQMLTVMITTGK